MNIAEWTIKNKVFSLIILMFILIGGYFAYEKLGRLEDPEYTIKDAIITTQYPGATALEVEQEVTEVIENAVQQLGALDEVESISKPGLSIVTATIKDKYDKHTLPQVWDELRRKVNDTQMLLPPGTSSSLVNDDFGDVFGILLALSGDNYTYPELKNLADDLKKELLLVPDVAKVIQWGTQQEQIFVEISRSKLAQLGIPLDQIYYILSKQNLVTESGQVRVVDQYIRIQPTGGINSVEALENLIITSGDKSVYLKDIADIHRGLITPPSKHLRFNGKDAIALGISIAPGGNVVHLGEAVRQKLSELESRIPYGIDIDTIYYQSDGVSKAVNGFIVNLIEALIIVVLVLLFFMGTRSGLLIGASLLITICASFIVMQIYAIPLQRISLGALIIALGMLVDNAIVITEGILVRIQKKMPALDAAKEVVNQSLWPLFGATAVAILAFAAIGLSQDSTGEYTRSLFQVLLISLGLSWLIAITLTPLLCVLFLKPSAKQENQDPYAGSLFTSYKRFLLLALRWRRATVGVVLFLLMAGFYVFSQLEDSFFPESTSPLFLVHYWLPEGTDIRRTSEDLKKIESYIQTLDGVTSTSTFVGEGAPRFLLVYSPEKQYDSYGLIIVNVNDYHKNNELIKKIKPYISNHFIDANPKLEKIKLGPGGGYDLEVRFSGEDPNILRALAMQAETVYFNDWNIEGVRQDWRERVTLVSPLYNEAKATRVGLSRKSISDALQTTFSGLKVGIYREAEDLIPIVSRAPKEERTNIDNIQNIQVWSQTAQSVIPLRQVVDGFETTWEDRVIHRKNKKRTLTAQASVAEGNASVVFDRTQKDIEAITLPPSYEKEWGGEYENSTEAKTKLFAKIPLTILLMILITIGLFNALKQPLIIWLTVPLAIIGVAFGLFLTGQSFGFMALLGFLSLTGMLIKNAIVLIDEMDLQVKTNADRLQAVIEASLSRLRPVLMAAATTILGMIPLLTDVFFVGMAVTIMAGLLFATLLTLIVVPVFYCLFLKIPTTTKGEA